MTADAVGARRWFVGGGPALKRMVLDAFREFGVSTYTQPELRPVPAWDMEAATRAFLKILDQVNVIALAQIKGLSPGLKRAL